MNKATRNLTCFIFGLMGLVLTNVVTAQIIDFRKNKNSIEILHGDETFAEFVFKDSKIKRPYLAHLKTPSGVQSSRNHPPTKKDDGDHATMHPGIWLAFGDINGHDYWRNKAEIKVNAIVRDNKAFETGGEIITRHIYLADEETVCVEVCQLGFHVIPAGYLITIDSRFSGPKDFYFGDQEEMGLGMRLATPIAEKNGGKIIDSQSRTSAKEAWGKTAKWIDYHGKVKNQTVGQMLIAHPKNFRPSWMHARNYGFVAANPFGRKAFGKGETSRVEINKGEELRLRFGILLHSDDDGKLPDFDQVYNKYLKLSQ